MPEPPLCRSCSKPIAKKTGTVKVAPSGANRTNHREWPGYRYVYADDVMDKEACQRLTNQMVVSVQYKTHEHWDDKAGGYKRYRGPIHQFSEWDGTSYQDPYFCNGTCATRFAYAMAKAFPNARLKK